MNHTPGIKEQQTVELYISTLKLVVDEFSEQYPWITVFLLLAIVSRETWWGWAPGYTIPGNPAGKGDNGHGHGFFQIDDRSHASFINSGLWSNPKAAARYAIKSVLIISCAYLKKRFPDMDDEDLIRATIAAYNCGAGNVRRSINEGGILNVDRRTAGRDYSKDVLELQMWWNEWLTRKEKKMPENFTKNDWEAIDLQVRLEKWFGHCLRESMDGVQGFLIGAAFGPEGREKLEELGGDPRPEEIGFEIAIKLKPFAERIFWSWVFGQIGNIGEKK